MDISSFSDDNFNVKDWVNQILKAGEKEKKDSNYTMGLVMKLQLYVQQVNNSLENTSEQILVSLPKIMRDAKLLHQEAVTLKDQMRKVKVEIAKIEEDTSTSINTIEQLDKKKTELAIAKQGLYERDNWSILVSDLEENFDSKNIEVISNKILSMQNSLKLLVNIADYEDRKLQLEGLKNRLEAIASPIIVQLFLSYNTEQSVKFVHIFSSIGRMSQLMKYYHNCQKDILVKKWRSQLEVEQDESVIQWMHNYYDILLSNWYTQIKWLNQVFVGENVTNCLLSIYIDVLNSLDPSLNKCIDAALKQAQDKLSFLHDVKDVTKRFAENIASVVGMHSGEIDLQKYQNLLKAIYSHMVVYVCMYAAYEQAHLLKQMNAVNCIKEELPETIQALGLSINQVFDYALEAKRRCQKLTEHCGFCGLLVALRAFFSSYAGYYRVALRQIDRSKKSQEDWSTFQLCLSLLQYTGDVLLKIEQLEKELTLTVLELNKKDASVEYKELLLNNDNLQEYESLVKCVAEGTQLSLLDHVTMEFSKLCSDIHHTTYQVVFGPISKQLEVVSSEDTWAQFDGSSLHNADLPDYSFSPQEYITQIGQYLMTLPQHLEPFLFKENPSLACALKSVDQEYAEASDVEGALAQIFLRIIARGTCNNLVDKILSICKLSNPASRQLAHDINYLNNVLQDLGLALSDNLQQLCILLKIPSDQYPTQSIGCSPRYVAAVRQIRNITSN